MSDFPELDLFEEIVDISRSNSPDFASFTQKEFNNTWSHYMHQTTSVGSNDSWLSSPLNTATTTTTSLQSPSITTTASSKDRDSWDPRLNIALGNYTTDLEMDSDNNCSHSVLGSLQQCLDQDCRPSSPLDNSHDLVPLFEQSQDLILSRTRTISPNSVNMRKRMKPSSPRSLKRKFFPTKTTKKSGQNNQSNLVLLNSQRPTREIPIDLKVNINLSDTILTLKGKNKKLKKSVYFERKKLSDARQLIKKLKSKLNSVTPRESHIIKV